MQPPAITQRFVDERLWYTRRESGYPIKSAQLRRALIDSRQALACQSLVRFAEDTLHRVHMAVKDYAETNGHTPSFRAFFKNATRGGFDTSHRGLITVDHTNFTYSIMYEWLCCHSESFRRSAAELSMYYPALGEAHYSRTAVNKKGDLIEICLARCRYYEPAMLLLRTETLPSSFEASPARIRLVYAEFSKCCRSLNCLRELSKWVKQQTDQNAHPKDFVILLDNCHFLDDPRSLANGTFLATDFETRDC